MRPDATTISSLVKAAGVPGVEVESTSLGVVARVEPRSVHDTLQALRDGDHEYRMLADMLGTDTGEGVEITYHLRSFSRDEEVYVKCSLPYGGTLASMWNLFPSALMPERETAELFGLSLSGHPNPKRLFTTEAVDPLLLKSVPIRTLEEVRDR